MLVGLLSIIPIMNNLLEQRFFRLLSEYSQRKVSASEFTEAIEELATHLADFSLNEQDYCVLLRYFSFGLHRLKSYRVRFEQELFRVGTQSVQRNACCTGSVGPVPGLVLQPCISGVHDIVAAGHSDVLVRHRTSVCSQPALRQLFPHVYGVDYISIIHCLDLSQRSDYIVIDLLSFVKKKKQTL